LLTPSHALILFDGVCNLCNGFVQFVIARDPGGRFQFGALQSAAAQQVLAQYDLPRPLPDSIVLVEDGRIFTRSTAALRIARHLTFPWRLAGPLLVVPPSWRDWTYDLVAHRRYRWFGRREYCMIPTPGIQSRFID
jgi:predicted DCC family thiol-disulfide oxidoreductase YuxK